MRLNDYPSAPGSLYIRLIGLCVVFLLAVFACLQPVQSQAQTLPTSSTEPELAQELEPLLERAREKGLSVIVVSPGDGQKRAADTGPSLRERALTVRTEFMRVIAKAPQLPGEIIKTLEARSPDGTYKWLLLAIVTAIGGIAVGTIPTRFLRKFNQQYFRHKYNPEPASRVEKISYLMFRAVAILINVLVMAAVALTVALLLDSGHDASYGTIGVILVAYVSYRVFRHVFFFNLIAPDTPSHRMLNLDDEAANEMQVHWRNIAMAVIIISSFFVWLALIGLPSDALKLLVVVSLFLCACIMAWGFVRHRKHFEGIILGAGNPARKPAWRRLLASQWHVLMLLYLACAWAVSVARIMLNLPSAFLVIAAPVIALVGCIVVYALLLILIDRFYGARQRRFEERVALAREQRQQEEEARLAAREEARRQAALADPDSDDEDDEEIINEIMSANTEDEPGPFQPVFKTVLEEAAGVLVLILGLAYVLGTWDVSIGEKGNPLTAFMDTLVVAFMGWFLYRAVVVYVDNQMRQEGEEPGQESDEPGDEMSGKGATRLATLLPLLRNVLIAAIAILTFMIILSNFGVDIAPLFAGAGVIGLAIGFGAQTLIRDIFSGGFFLFDDAFRKGEYIEMDNIRGTVEKISLRSFQLRHHNGPLHTIPFGEIKQLTNYSRDWVMMKLPLRLTYDTDVERVRKLVKKLGQRLLEHPEVGHLFVQPLKSQGVYSMEDSAMIIRVKFMTKPGDQFVTRKVVYAAIRDLFEQEGIRFASKEVTVRLADEPTRPLEPAEKTAIAAAARRVHDDENAAQTGQDSKSDDGP